MQNETCPLFKKNEFLMWFEGNASSTHVSDFKILKFILIIVVASRQFKNKMKLFGKNVSIMPGFHQSDSLKKQFCFQKTKQNMFSFDVPTRDGKVFCWEKQFSLLFLVLSVWWKPGIIHVFLDFWRFI